MANISWEKIRESRSLAARILKPLHRYPVIKDSRELLFRYAKSDAALLDVGANDRNLERTLARNNKKLNYFSCDIDRSLRHDYYDLGQIDRTFDIACLFDVIEHVPPPDAFDMLEKINALLNPGGMLMVSTPNVDHPTRFWRDCTHITPFRYDELAGFLIAAGFSNIEIWRVCRMRWQERLRLIFAAPTLRLLGVDYCPSIVVVGRK